MNTVSAVFCYLFSLFSWLPSRLFDIADCHRSLKWVWVLGWIAQIPYYAFWVMILVIYWVAVWLIIASCFIRHIVLSCFPNKDELEAAGVRLGQGRDEKS